MSGSDEGDVDAEVTAGPAALRPRRFSAIRPPSGWPRELIKLGLILWVVWLVYDPARGARDDVAAQREIVTAQLGIAEVQLREVRRTRELADQALGDGRRVRQIAQETLSEVQRSRELAEQSLAQAEAAVDAAEQTLALVEAIEGRAAEGIALLREQLSVAQDTLRTAQVTLQEVREINDKTPNSTKAVP